MNRLLIRSLFPFFLAGTLLLAGCKPDPGEIVPETISITGETMGTTYSIRIVEKNPEELDESRQKVIAGKIQDELNRINGIFSTWIEGSEISKINRAQARIPIPLSPEMEKLLLLSIRLNKDSSGAFDPGVGPLIELWGFGKENHPTPPSPGEIGRARSYSGIGHIKISNHTLIKNDSRTTINLSAVAKGYGVDMVAEQILLFGFENYMVEIGGEVRTRGKNAKDLPWKIGIENPDPEKRSLFGTMELTQGAVATSGDYRNFIAAREKRLSHILDPVTGSPIQNGIVSVSVRGPDCTTADALATTLMILPPKRGLQLLKKYPGFEGMILSYDHNGEDPVVERSAGFEFERIE